MYNSRVHCKTKVVSSTPNAQHTYGEHAHLFPSGVLCTQKRLFDVCYAHHYKLRCVFHTHFLHTLYLMGWCD